MGICGVWQADQDPAGNCVRANYYRVARAEAAVKPRKRRAAATSGASRNVVSAPARCPARRSASAAGPGSVEWWAKPKFDRGNAVSNEAARIAADNSMQDIPCVLEAVYGVTMTSLKATKRPGPNGRPPS